MTKPRQDPGTPGVQYCLQKILPRRARLGKIEQERRFWSVVFRLFRRAAAERMIPTWQS